MAGKHAAADHGPMTRVHSPERIATPRRPTPAETGNSERVLSGPPFLCSGFVVVSVFRIQSGSGS